MKIGLLICGKLPSALERRGTSHSRMLQDWLSPVAHKCTFRPYRAYAGKLPPKVDTCDCYFVSGSASSILEREPWQKKLCNFLLVAAKAQVPVVGICFGHQALAEALGGRAAHAPKGWEVGVKTWKIVRDEGWMRECGKKLTLLSIHRDQVVKLPPRSVRVASRDRCPNGMFRLANHAIGIQGHPEMTNKVFTEILELRKSSFTDEERKEALESLEIPTQAKDMARWCVNFVETRA